MNDNAPVPNPVLRQHVTDHAFVLTLRKTHIMVLQALAHGSRSVPDRSSYWVSAARGCQDRGLVISHPEKALAKEARGRKTELRDFYSLTRAGDLAFALLVESGLAEPKAKKQRKAA